MCHKEGNLTHLTFVLSFSLSSFAVVDCTQAGPGDLGVDVTFNGRPVVTHISPTSTPGLFKVNFTPFSPGPYEINVHFNRAEVRGEISWMLH